ncbi:hypothetical protein NT6N_08070 [Oceaniferula spumae]|uniref:Methyltransferase domain-containing protein n=1 Tax=Oceaniferula spumae TaxID=2979115 RepID=A0AAT9FIL7_9BACT
MNPFSRALTDYHSGCHDTVFVIRRDDGYEQTVPVAPFFDSENFPPLESRALDECRGRVLDVGSAAGRHSLELLRRGMKVTSLDILPEMEAIMKDRGLSDVVIADIFTFSGERYDTLLMLMNGIGMTATFDGLLQFLRHAHNLIAPGGQIVCDSIDVGVTKNPQHVVYRERNLASGRLPGQQVFTIEYDGEPPIQFDWLHIDFQTLSKACDETGWKADLLSSEEGGHYLCRLAEG